MKQVSRFLGPVLLLAGWSAACATTRYDDASAEPAAAPPGPACPERSDEDACLVDDIAACCVVVSIPHEYEWLDARERGDASASEHHYGRMVELLDHGCALGHEEACRTLQHVSARAR